MFYALRMFVCFSPTVAVAVAVDFAFVMPEASFGRYQTKSQDLKMYFPFNVTYDNIRLKKPEDKKKYVNEMYVCRW